MHRHRRGLVVAAVAGLLLNAACSGRRDDASRQAALGAPTDAATGSSAARGDAASPLAALRATAGEAAARVGAIAWEGRVSWQVSRPGVAPVAAAEKHRLRQLASGDFELETEIDPGTGPGSSTGSSVIYARGMTYARGRWAPFRERPTDRGEGARRHRDDSFRMAADLADLYGPSLQARPAGEAVVLGRRARKYALALTGQPAKPTAATAALPDGGSDPDTRARMSFLAGRLPSSLDGELLVDAATGIPLSVAMRGKLSEAEHPEVLVEVDLAAHVTALGPAVRPVTPPRAALADERKPKGVARALEAAGLRNPTRSETPEDEEPGEGQGGE